MSRKIVYFDNSATTAVDKEVIKEMSKYFDKSYGNASSSHQLGVEAKKVLEKSREIIAKSIGAEKDEIIFTSGGTESNNLAIKGVALERGHIITTKIEHKSVLETCKDLEKAGFEITYLNVDKEGFVLLDELKKSIKSDTFLVSIIHGNNEIGTLQDLEEIGKICKEKDILFHTDACQSYTKNKIDVNEMNLSLVSLNAHKIHGPKGVGVLYIRKGTKMKKLFCGGEQENKLRAGTENISGIAGFAKAVEIGMKKDVKKITKMRDKIIESVLKIEGVKLNGSREKRLCNNANFSFKGVEGEAIVGYLDEKGICASTGSACSELTLEPSYVLKAIGRNHEDSNSSLRISLSRITKEEEVDYFLKVLPGIIKKLRAISPFGEI